MGSPEKTALTTKLARYVRTARIWLVWERYVPVFLWAAVLISVFLIGAFSGIWERIGDPWRAIAAIAALAFLIHAAFKAQKRPLPSLSEAKRRVEMDSGQSHRPLDVLEDHPAIGAEGWPAHYTKALKQAQSLNRPGLRPTVGPRDPYFARLALPCALILALIIGNGANMERLRRAVTPVWQAGINPDNVSFEAWIDPPDYTGRPPIYFKGQDIQKIPAGSEWVVRLNGAKSVPRPKLRQGDETNYLRLNQLSDETFEARAIIRDPGVAVWRIGPKRKVWDLNVIQDQFPIVTLDDTPKADKQDRLVISYSFKDDYGVTNLSLEMAEITETEGDPFADSSAVGIPLNGGSMPKADAAESKIDLTRHPLAGKKVIARLKATDGAGQSAFSSESWFRVPDKIFVEPLAKAVIEQRAIVLQAIDSNYAPEANAAPPPGQIYGTFNPTQRLDRAPAGIERAAKLIEAVTDRPDGLFSDPSVYLGLRNVRSRLRYARNLETIKPIPDELWSIALRAEYGVLGTALEEMREAEQALREGMARQAPQREIDTLFKRYNNAVDAYTEELKRQALEEGNFAEQESGGGSGSMGTTDEIEELRKAIEEAFKAGDVEGARRALAQLALLLENMQMQLSQQSGGGDGEGLSGEMSEEMKKNLEELADLLGEQRELQDETDEAERQAQEDPNGEQSGSPQPGLSPGELATRQEGLEELLGRLGENEGQAAELGAGSDDQAAGGQNEDGEGGNQPGGERNENGGGGTEAAQDELDRARDSMSGAAEALSRGDYAGAGEAQEEAVQALREAGEKLAESLQSQGEGESGEGQNATDPLGRQQGGENSENAETDIDPDGKANRSRELMEELRRRAAERERRKEEREYLERLLERF